MEQNPFVEGMFVELGQRVVGNVGAQLVRVFLDPGVDFENICQGRLDVCPSLGCGHASHRDCFGEVDHHLDLCFYDP
jgi:hypothetical protein